MAARRTYKTEIHATTSLGHPSRVKLFVAPQCNACAEAKQILDAAGVRYSTVVVQPEEQATSKAKGVTADNKKSDTYRFALPRLMIGPHQVGNLERIKELHLEGKLLRVLDQA